MATFIWPPRWPLRWRPSRSHLQDDTVDTREHRLAGEAGTRVVGAAARERDDARRIAAQGVERFAERACVAGWNEDSRLAVAHDLGHSTGCRGDDRSSGEHRLDEDATEGLGQYRGMYDDVARGEESRHVVARAEHVDAAGEGGQLGAGAQLLLVRRLAAEQRATHDERMH